MALAAKTPERERARERFARLLEALREKGWPYTASAFEIDEDEYSYAWEAERYDARSEEIEAFIRQLEGVSIPSDAAPTRDDDNETG